MTPDGLRVRPGTLDDAHEVVRLRRLMFEEMGASQDETWRPRALEAFRSGITAGSLFAMVVDDPDGPGLIASGIATISPVLPGPGVTGSLKATISSMSTDHGWRRRGLARLVLAGLLDRIDARDDIAWTELLATAEGERLYTSVGFGPHVHPTLRRPAPLRRPSGFDEDPTAEIPIPS